MVDDYKTMARIIRNLLKQIGFKDVNEAADGAIGSIPFIMATAEAKSENVIAAKKAEVSNYIVKPFNAQTLKGKIDAVFEEQER